MGAGIAIAIVGVTALIALLMGRGQAPQGLARPAQPVIGQDTGETAKTPEGSPIGTAKGQGDPTQAGSQAATTERTDVEVDLYRYTRKDYGIPEEPVQGVLRGNLMGSSAEQPGTPKGPSALVTDRTSMGGPVVE